MKSETISLNELLARQNKQLDNSVITSSDVIVIPDPRLSIDDIFVIKKIRKEGKKVHIPNLEDTHYQELRGGEFELALMIVSQTALPVVLSITSSWIYDKIKSYSEMKKKIKNPDINRPPFKVKYYLTKKEKYIELEGEPEEVLKALDKLKNEENDSS